MKKFSITNLLRLLVGILGGGARDVSSSRQAKFGFNALITGIVFCAILVVINLIFKNAGLRWDLTKNKIYSLSDQTVNLVKSIKEPVKVYAFFTSDPRNASQKDEAKKLLDEYSSRSPNFKYEFIDPYRNQALAMQYGITRNATLVVTKGTNKEQTTTITESELTAALIKLENPTKVNVLFWSGQGERDIDGTDDNGYSEVKANLEKLNYVVSKQDMNKDPQIPENTGVVVIVGPQNSYVQKHVDALSNYLKKGGKAMILLDVMKDNRKSGLEDLLTKYGVGVDYGYTIDGEYKNPFIAVEKFPKNQITESLSPVLFLGSLQVKPFDKKPDSASVVTLADSGSNSWLEFSPLRADQEPKKDGQDISGPISLGVAMKFTPPEDKKDSPEFKTRIIVFGDADLGSNLLTQYAAGKQFYSPGNGDILINSVNWLAARENLINIVPKDRTRPTLSITDSQSNQVRNIVLFVLPGAALLIGAIVWRSRKKLKNK